MKNLPKARIPIATYRLQFTPDFRFKDATKIISYLHELGITDIYSSPYLKAKEGSTHGYNVVDYNELNSELGSLKEYNEMIDEIAKYNMGQILDIVPNHMCVTSKENQWWMDVLENGPSAHYAKFFDINWQPAKKELEQKVLLPILGEQYGKVLENQELKLCFKDGTFFISYYEHVLPIQPKTYLLILNHEIENLKSLLDEDDPILIELLSIITALHYLPDYTEKDQVKIKERYREKEIVKQRLGRLYDSSQQIKAFIDKNVMIFNGEKGNIHNFDLLDNLLRQQVYRLSFWCVAIEEINYRRFFDINELAAVRVEDPDVYNDTHKLIFKLIREGKVTGLRVDHPDGLYDPSAYLYNLQRDAFIQLCLSEETSPDNQTHETLGKKFDNEYVKNPSYIPFYILGEKILSGEEKQPQEWPIYSLTGYRFLNTINNIFVETKNSDVFKSIYHEFIKKELRFDCLVYKSKKLIIEDSLSSEINMLAYHLNRLSEYD
ncbi:MAG: hypothetical protein L3V56_12780, partial [Candidatus Magnetoovum sp. WYHC-5]|nr:hypothetical protein [Candidatus Magnetoovum sp. WYHC-5]